MRERVNIFIQQCHGWPQMPSLRLQLNERVIQAHAPHCEMFPINRGDSRYGNTTAAIVTENADLIL